MINNIAEPNNVREDIRYETLKSEQMGKYAGLSDFVAKNLANFSKR